MASAHHLIISDCVIFEAYREVGPDTMILFRERDKRVFERRISERNEMAWGPADEASDEVELAFEYRATAKEVRQRLEIMGFTIAKAEIDFAESKESEIERRKQFPM